MAVPKTDLEYVKMLETAAAQKTFYWNKYPYNLGYYHGDQGFSFDCVNLVKAVLGGWQPKKTVGYFVNNLSRTGDVTEWGLLEQCDYSTNFSKMDCVAVLYMEGHIGSFINKEVTINGTIRNVIECTGAFGGGVVYSYVDSSGRRFNHKGGTQAGRWSHWGKMVKWLTYTKKDESMFTDVKADAKYYDVYKTLCEMGIMGKDSKGRFKPKTKVTRSVLAIVAYRILRECGKIR